MYHGISVAFSQPSTSLLLMEQRQRKVQASPVEAPPRLPYSQVFFYSLGHVFNDLCAATWFSYLLPFLTFAARLSSGQAGIVMFSGQIAVSAEFPTRIVGLVPQGAH